MSRPLLLVLVAILAGVAASIATVRIVSDQHSEDDRDMLDWHPHEPTFGR
jgi:hypothetical protein